jgi:pyruvate dehydrogenase E2 component (dihydrolipoamide acetyltransferase)
MAERIIMPKTGMAMEEGVIIKWLKTEGDAVEKGEPIAEIETDKAAMELESDYEGTLLKILYPELTTVPVVETIAWIGERGEQIPDDPQVGVVENPGFDKIIVDPEMVNTSVLVDANLSMGKIKATPAAKKAAAKKNIRLEKIVPSGKFGEVRACDVLAVKGSAITPLAARIAADKNIDVTAFSGSGYSGKIFKTDLNSDPIGYQKSRSDNFEDELIALTRIQKITGKRMLQSYTEVPAVTENTKVDVTELLEIRKNLNESLKKSFTINDFILLATAKALRKNLRMNSVLEFEGNSILCKGHINLGMAVATSHGLLVPVISDADMYSITGLSEKAGELSMKCRSGQLQLSDMEGGTFTVSNVGMFGITSFTPIINQPEAGILGVCTIEDQLKLIDGNIINRKVMGLSLTFDHRIVDGAEAAVFIKSIKDFLEIPLTFLD